MKRNSGQVWYIWRGRLHTFYLIFVAGINDNRRKYWGFSLLRPMFAQDNTSARLR